MIISDWTKKVKSDNVLVQTSKIIGKVSVNTISGSLVPTLLAYWYSPLNETL